MTTAMFGERKFGTFQFGPTNLAHPRFGLEIDWDMDGAFDGRNDGMNLSAMTIERGRRYSLRADGTGFEEEETGRFSATLVDLNRDYDPYNIRSPLYPNVGPGRLFRVRVRTPGGQYYPLMAGTLSEPVIGLDPGLLTISLSGSDGWAYLRDQKSRISVQLQENIHADDAIRMILDNVGFPSVWGYDIAPGLDWLPFWWVANQSAAAALHEVAFSELGKIYIAANGRLTFRNRHYFDPPTVTITKEDIQRGTLNIMEPWETIRNSVQVIASPRSEQPTGVLWQLPRAIYVNANSSAEVFIDFTYNNNNCPAVNIIQPVPVTDYSANTDASGGGTDLTSSFSISADVFSTGAKLTIRNNGNIGGYLLTADVRGNAITASDTVKYQVDDITSQNKLKAIRSFTLSLDWMQTTQAARAAARYLGALLPLGRKYLSFDLLPNPELQFWLDLGKPLNISLPEDGIEAVYRVHYLRHELTDEAGLTTRTTVMAEPYPLPDEDYWILPKQIPMKVAY